MRRYRSYSRRGRSRATWAYADAEQMQLVGGGGSPPVVYSWLLPPGRVNYLLDTDRVSSMKFMGCHMWLDFNWVNTASFAAMPDVTIYAIVTQQNEVSQAPDELFVNPWAPPEVPASLTSWTTYNDDGTSPFLWCHHIKGQTPPNWAVYTGQSGTTQFNQGNSIGTGTSDAPTIMCRKFFVAAEWQPDVIIKSRRKLVKDDGVALLMRSDSTFPTGMYINLSMRVRTLVSRGR